MLPQPAGIGGGGGGGGGGRGGFSAPGGALAPAPGGQGPSGQLDDLAFDMAFDAETADKIRHISAAKNACVNNEDYEAAKALKQVEQQMKAIGVQLAKMESQKSTAVAREDYDAAQGLKREIARLRQGIEQRLSNIPAFDAYLSGLRENSSGRANAMPPPQKMQQIQQMQQEQMQQQARQMQQMQQQQQQQIENQMQQQQQQQRPQAQAALQAEQQVSTSGSRVDRSVLVAGTCQKTLCSSVLFRCAPYAC